LASFVFFTFFALFLYPDTNNKEGALDKEPFDQALLLFRLLALLAFLALPAVLALVCLYHRLTNT
jgi:hypothetical protein